MKMYVVQMPIFDVNDLVQLPAFLVQIFSLSLR